MKRKKFILFHCCISLLLISVLFVFCTSPENPFDPKNVTIDLVVPENADSPFFTGDTVQIGIVIYLSLNVDSVVLSIGDYFDSTLREIADTITVIHVLRHTGTFDINATAYINNGTTKQDTENLEAFKNPLVPPANILFKIDTSLSSFISFVLYWESVSVALKYNIYRSYTDTTGFMLLSSLADTFYIDSNIIIDTTYYYKVSTIDSTNKESPLSDSIASTIYAPVITSEPFNTSGIVGDTVLFYVCACGNPRPLYKWERDSLTIPGETNDTLLVQGISTALDKAKYRALVYNAVDSVYSKGATLSVVDKVSKWGIMKWDEDNWN